MEFGRANVEPILSPHLGCEFPVSDNSIGMKFFLSSFFPFFSCFIVILFSSLMNAVLSFRNLTEYIRIFSFLWMEIL